MAKINLGKVVPEKGVDYYTEAEKTALKTEIEQEIDSSKIQPISQQVQALQEEQTTQGGAIQTLQQTVGNQGESIETIEEHSESQDADIEELQTKVTNLEETVNSELEDGTVEGTEITVEDSATADAEIEIEGNIYQNKYTGKNLLPNNGASTITIQGITYTKNEDGSIKINGTATGTSADYYFFGSNTDTGDYLFIPQGTYSLSETISNQNSWLVKEKTLGSLAGSTAIKNALESQDCYFYGVAVRTKNNQSVTDFIFYPQLEANETSTDYEKYVGGHSSPSIEYPQPIHLLKGINKLNINNSNLFIKETITRDHIYQGNGTYREIAEWDVTDYIVIPKNNNLTYNGLTERGSSPALVYFDKNKNYISGVRIQTFTTTIEPPNNAKYVRFTLKHTDLSTFQINIGNILFPYEEGKQQIKTLTLPNELEMGKINTHRDKFIKQGNNWIVPNKIQKIESYNGETITTDYISTTGGLDTGATVYYVGDTDLTITDTTLIAELEALLKLRSYYGQTNIIVEAEDLEPNIIFYYKKSPNRQLEKYFESKNLARIFKKVCCVGDSYTAGYIVDSEGTVHDTNEQFAFPHYMSLITGNDWQNCGVSGANSKSWLTNENGLAKAQSLGKVQAYIVGLMINDSSDRSSHVDVGTIDDIGTNADTYYAYYSKIVRELNTISPQAKIFIETCPKNEEQRYNEYNNAVKNIYNTYKETYPVYLLDLHANIDLYENPVLQKDKKSGHYTAIGYEQFAEILNDLLSKYISENIKDFQDVAFIEYDTNQTEQ